jgi:hypothetical protein
VISLAGNNPFIAAIIPLTILTVVVATFIGEQGAVGYFAQRSASLQADFAKPLDYRELDARQVIALVLPVSIVSVIPARRLYEFLKVVLTKPEKKI